MLLFYSAHCAHCKMLLETVQRSDPDGRLVKRVSIDALRAAGKAIPPAVHSVPALMLMPDKRWLYGKHVFDHLLMPGRGALAGGKGLHEPLGGPGGPAGPGREPAAAMPAAAGAGAAGEPGAFEFTSGLGEAFAPFDNNQTAVAQDAGLSDRSYQWSAVSEAAGPGAGPGAGAVGPTGGPAIGQSGSETRSRKQLPSLEDIRRARAEI